MIVYKITNLINGKIYVGQTQRTLNQRFSEHAKADTPLGRAIRKYGKENFKREIIEECASIEELNERETFWIKEFDCIVPKGYNQTNGGSSSDLDEESRARISATLKKYYVEHPEEREKISEDQKKRFEDPEERAKAAERTRKAFENPEIREKHSESQRKRFENPEEREKISAIVTERFSDPEERKKQSERITKYFDDPAAREKCSVAQKKRFESEEARAKHSEIMKEYYAQNPPPPMSPETRKKISDARKAYWARIRAEKETQAEVEQLSLREGGADEKLDSERSRHVHEGRKGQSHKTL